MCHTFLKYILDHSHQEVVATTTRTTDNQYYNQYYNYGGWGQSQGWGHGYGQGYGGYGGYGGYAPGVEGYGQEQQEERSVLVHLHNEKYRNHSILHFTCQIQWIYSGHFYVKQEIIGKLVSLNYFRSTISSKKGQKRILQWVRTKSLECRDICKTSVSFNAIYLS